MNDWKFLAIFCLSLGFCTTQNHAPEILNIEFSPDIIYVSDTVQLCAEAIDEDNNLLSFQWQSESGWFENDSECDGQWIAPGTSGVYTVSVTVSDERGASDEQGIHIPVQKITKTILDSTFNVPGGSCSAIRKVVDGGWTVSGNWQVDTLDLTFFALDAENYYLWTEYGSYVWDYVRHDQQNQGNFQFITRSSGYVYFVFDNTTTPSLTKIVTVSISASSP